MIWVMILILLLFFTILSINLHANTPVIKDDKKPISKIQKLISLLNILPDKMSLRIAPKITGITIKKENFAASFLSFPKKIDVQIVEPDLEIPGIIAKAWAIPIIRECDLVISLFPDFMILVKNNNNPVIIKITNTKITPDPGIVVSKLNITSGKYSWGTRLLTNSKKNLMTITLKIKGIQKRSPEIR